MPELIPYDTDSRKVLELTFREALRLGHNYVGTEHILLALLALLEFEGGSGVLSGLGVEKDAVWAAVETAVTEAAAALWQQKSLTGQPPGRGRRVLSAPRTRRPRTPTAR